MAVEDYDLEERLISFAVRIIRLSEALPKTRAGNHVARQLLACGTSPQANHGEAQAAESTKDFLHKLRISLKELRETHRWLKLIERVPLIVPACRISTLTSECEELVRIFVTSIKTAEKRL